MKYNKFIDHTLLKADASIKAVKVLCDEAKEYDFASVCINPGFVKFCAKELKGTDVKVCTVVGFPLGATSTASKAFETKQAVEDGAEEIDMVINISALKDGNDDYVYEDIRAVVVASSGKLVKVIIESCLLTDEEKVRVCLLAKKAGADFVKTSTGFSISGATTHDVALMRKTVGTSMGVKASGGIRTREDLVAMIDAGANRIGTSSGTKII